MLKIKKERRSVHVSIDLIRQYSDLSQHIKEPQNVIYCLNFCKNYHILKRRPCFIPEVTCSVLSVSVLSVSSRDNILYSLSVYYLFAV